MLLADKEAPPWGRVRTGYQVQASAHYPDGRSASLGSTAATTPRLTIRWLRRRTRDVADQLDPPYARPLRAWLNDDTEQERALARLAHGERYELQAEDDGGVAYVLAAWPVVVDLTPYLALWQAEGTAWEPR
jgi:hypothetical protein